MPVCSLVPGFSCSAHHHTSSKPAFFFFIPNMAVRIGSEEPTRTFCETRAHTDIRGMSMESMYVGGVCSRRKKEGKRKRRGREGNVDMYAAHVSPCGAFAYLIHAASYMHVRQMPHVDVEARQGGQRCEVAFKDLQGARTQACN